MLMAAEIDEVKIEGDTATVMMTVEGDDAPEGGGEKPLIFTKIDSNWYLDMIASEKASAPAAEPTDEEPTDDEPTEDPGPTEKPPEDPAPPEEPSP